MGLTLLWSCSSEETLNEDTLQQNTSEISMNFNLTKNQLYKYILIEKGVSKTFRRSEIEDDKLTNLLQSAYHVIDDTSNDTSTILMTENDEKSFYSKNAALRDVIEDEPEEEEEGGSSNVPTEFKNKHTSKIPAGNRHENKILWAKNEFTFAVGDLLYCLPKSAKNFAAMKNVWYHHSVAAKKGKKSKGFRKSSSLNLVKGWVNITRLTFHNTKRKKTSKFTFYSKTNFKGRKITVTANKHSISHIGKHLTFIPKSYK